MVQKQNDSKALEVQIKSLESESTVLLAKADSFQIISTVEEQNSAMSVMAEEATKLKRIETARKFFTQPLNEHVKKINNMFRAFSDPLAGSRTRIDIIVKEFRKAENERGEAEQRRLEEEARKKQLKEEKKAEKKGVTPPPPPIVPKVDNLDKTVRTASGTVSIKKVLKFRVKDEDKIPRPFCSKDDKKIREAMRNGVREIPGIEIYEDEEIAIR